MNTVTDPLLQLDGLPRFAALEPAAIEPALDTLLIGNRALVERLATATEPADWERFVQPLEDTDDRLSRLWAPVSQLHGVCDSEALRSVYEACLAKLTDYHTAMGQDARLYQRFQAVAAAVGFGDLGVAQRRIVTNALRDFRLGGVDLPTIAKQRFRDISQALSRLGNGFEQNVLDATGDWCVQIEDRTRLAGLPDSALRQARAAADADHLAGWKFTLQAPSYVPFLTYADDRELRRCLYEAYVTRASECGPRAGRHDNGPLMHEMLALRHEQAALLGFANYAEYSLVPKMAGSVSQVRDFLTDLATRTRPAAFAEVADLTAFARDQCGVDTLEAWDVAYYSEKLRQARFDFSQEDVRPYFPVNKVLDGLFAVVGRLFGITVRPAEAPDLWHSDVRFFEIVDCAVCGQFYVDLYARPHKRGGAWMAECINRRRDAAGRVHVPVAFVNCNATPPVGGEPALFTHDEVITLFHEFGHALHHMLTRIDYPAVAGINGVAWDAVEMPSQFLENWGWERAALDLISGHYRSGAPLPDPLLDKMRAARNFQAGMRMVRQLEFALFDLRLHSEFDPDGSHGIQAVLDAVRDEVAVLKPPAFNRFQNGFSHIFGGGYAAGYYSYLWAEVLSADAFSKFEQTGVFDAETGRSFRHYILEQGGVRDPMELFVAFRGRAPTVDALLRHTGLAA